MFLCNGSKDIFCFTTILTGGKIQTMSKLKYFFPILAVLFSFNLYALPDITLYESGEKVWQIRNNKFYDSDDDLVYVLQGDKLISTENTEQINIFKKFYELIEKKVHETESSIIFNNFYNGKLISFHEYSKLTGNLIRQNFLLSNEQIYDYDEKSGLGTKITWITNGKIDKYSLFEYDSENRLVKGSEYDSNGNLLKYKTLEYDSSGEEKLSAIFEYDSNGNLKSKTVYDTETEEPTECYRYMDGAKNAEKWNYLKFDDVYGEYIIDENFFLHTYSIPTPTFTFELLEMMTKDNFPGFEE